MSESLCDADSLADQIGDVFYRRGAESYLGECVTMSEHMLQCAMLAEEAGTGEALTVAALLHDIGHYTGEFPESALEEGIDNFHEVTGARVIVDFFPPLVVACVRWHVEAKRYLCATDSEYRRSLSPASEHSLQLQGGEMTEAQAVSFRAQPYLADILRVRRWDDAAKVAGRKTPSYTHYASMVRRVVNGHLGRQERP